jgi:hypothetical protein
MKNLTPREILSPWNIFPTESSSSRKFPLPRPKNVGILLFAVVVKINRSNKLPFLSQLRIVFFHVFSWIFSSSLVKKKKRYTQITLYMTSLQFYDIICDMTSSSLKPVSRLLYFKARHCIVWKQCGNYDVIWSINIAFLRLLNH